MRSAAHAAAGSDGGVSVRGRARASQPTRRRVTSGTCVN